MNLLQPYDFSFPPDLIAQQPARPRDSARLLVYDQVTGMTTHDTFRHLPKYLPPGTLIILNDTKVIPARLELRKESSGRVRVLFLGMEKGCMKALCDRRVVVGSTLTLASKIFFTVRKQHENFVWLVPSFPGKWLEKILQKYGTTPLPPYIKHSPLPEQKLRTEYQSVFARIRGAVAAPTAGLHFTPRLLRTLRKKGVEVRFVTLHVGLGTFAPLTAAHLRSRKLHAEWFELSRETAQAIHQAKKAGRPVVAVGTTVARVLESAASTRGVRAQKGVTRLFIRPGYRFKIIDGLITNFHVPRSSLMMLVVALVGRARLLSIYQEAIQKRYRLFSFGDAMLIAGLHR